MYNVSLIDFPSAINLISNLFLDNKVLYLMNIYISNLSYGVDDEI